MKRSTHLFLFVLAAAFFTLNSFAFTVEMDPAAP